MPGKKNSNVFNGALFIRDVINDYDLFNGMITADQVSSAFPVSTRYYDNIDGQEFTDAPTGSITNGWGDTNSQLTETPISLTLVGLTRAEYRLIYAKSGSQQDIAIIKTCGGLEGLGEGIVYRDRNIHVGAMKTIGGLSVAVITTSKKFEARYAGKFNQRFDIVPPYEASTIWLSGSINE